MSDPIHPRTRPNQPGVHLVKLEQQYPEPRPPLTTEWDEIDRLAMRAEPELLGPPIKTGKALRIAVYARFSSKAQRPRTIETQEKQCVRYYRTHLGGQSHTLYRDDAQTGTNADRDGLEALLDAVAKQQFDVVVVYSFDRLSREIFDGVPVIRILHEHNVELHSAHANRRLSKKDAVRDAIRSEEDNDLRRDLIMGGMDRLVEDENGIPWGWHYGLRSTRRRGHPEKDEKKAPVVLRITRDVVRKSGAKIAAELTAEGIPTPSGGAVWSPETVLLIAGNVANTGRVHYRRTSRIYDPKKKKKVLKKNPEYKWKKGVNENWRLVSDEEYIAAKRAMWARNTQKGGQARSKEHSALPIFGNPRCDCVDVQGQHFFLGHSNDKTSSHRYYCKLSHRQAGCCAELRSFRADTVELAIYQAIVPFLTARLQGFEVAFKASLADVADDLGRRRAEFRRQLDEAERRSDRLLRADIASTFDDESLKKVAKELKDRIASLRTALNSVPHISVDEVDFDGVRETLLGAFRLLRDRIPFIPADDDERALLAALREGVSRIQITQKGRLRGSLGLTITMQWERYFLPPEKMEACGFTAETIETEFFLPHAYTGNIGSMRHLSELAAGGLHALTDAQWSLVREDLPDLRFTDSQGARPASSTRSIVHCLIFITRMDLPMTVPPPFFGERKAVYFALLRLIAAGGIETLVSKIGKADPTWLEGLHFDRFKRVKRSSRVNTQPTLAAARYAKQRRYDLTHAQWSAISKLFGHHRLANPTGRRPSPIDMRTAMSGILTKLRSGCGWKKMPSRFGGSELMNVAIRICYQGAWNAAYDILKKEHPEVVEGLSTQVLDGFMRETRRRHPSSLRRSGSARGAQPSDNDSQGHTGKDIEIRNSKRAL